MSGYTDHLNAEIDKLQGKIERLQAVMDAADAFLAEPPEDMKDRQPFNQYTTAGDCRVLSEAYRQASEAAEAS